MCEIISVHDVTKVYGKQQVLKNVFLSCVEGRIYGLVGRNGSGKTVLLKCICGIVQPTGGEISVWGKRVGKDVDFPDNIGFIIETPGFLPHESGLSNLKHLASIQRKIGLQEIRESMELVGLDPDLKKTVGKYSMGMRQRLGIAQALLNEPKLLVLDEPTAGLDPKERVRFRNLIDDLGKDCIVLLSTHIVSDIEHIADDILMMKDGQMIYQGKWTDKSGDLEQFYLKQFQEDGHE